MSALQRQPAKLPLGKQPQHGPQPDEDLETSCTILSKHRLYDTEKATSNSSSLEVLEAQLREANGQCFKLAKAEKAFADQQTQSDRQPDAAKQMAAVAWKELQASEQKYAGLQHDFACYRETIVSDQKEQADARAAQDARHKRENDALQKQILHLATSSKHQIGVVTSGKLQLNSLY